MSESTNLSEAVLARFEQPKWGEPVPVLDEIAQFAIRTHFRETGMKMTAGFLNLLPDDVSMGTMVQPDLHKLMTRVPSLVIGPYFLDADYFKRGVGLWSSNDQQG